MSMFLRRLHLIPLILTLGLTALAQQGTAPTLTFTCDFPGSDPAHYGITVASDGHASYTSDGKLAQGAEADAPYTEDFTLPAASAAHIFDLAKQAHYFEGKIDSGNKKIASSGAKTLTYKDSQRNTTASYNYSAVPAVEDLTTWFQSLSATLEFGRRIEFERHYQKLALDEELKSLEDMASRGDAIEVHVIAPILQKVLDDPSVINTVRARAQRLLNPAGAK